MFESLKEYGQQEKQIRLMQDKLEDGKYKTVPFGHQLYVMYLL